VSPAKVKGLHLGRHGFLFAGNLALARRLLRPDRSNKGMRIAGTSSTKVSVDHIKLPGYGTDCSCN
jgi:hypothetical protein